MRSLNIANLLMALLLLATAHFGLRRYLGHEVMQEVGTFLEDRDDRDDPLIRGVRVVGTTLGLNRASVTLDVTRLDFQGELARAFTADHPHDLEGRRLLSETITLVLRRSGLGFEPDRFEVDDPHIRMSLNALLRDYRLYGSTRGLEAGE
jgi:hypothetical protein